MAESACSSNRELYSQFKMLKAMLKRFSVPRFERRLVCGNVSAAWQPAPIQPLEESNFAIDVALHGNFCDQHLRKSVLADFVRRSKGVLHFHSDVIAAVFQSCHFRIFKLITQPLSIGELPFLGPVHQTFGCLHDGIAMIRIVNPDVRDSPSRQLPNVDAKVIGI